MSIILLGTLLSGFGWALTALFFGAIFAVLFQDRFMGYFAKHFSVSECEDIEEIRIIEEVRAELATRLKARAQKAREGVQRAEDRLTEVEICIDEINRDISLATAEERMNTLIREMDEIAQNLLNDEENDMYETLAKRPEYWASWESMQRIQDRLDYLRSVSVDRLQKIRGVGPKRAKRIVEAGPDLTLNLLRKICGPLVTNDVLAWA